MVDVRKDILSSVVEYATTTDMFNAVWQIVSSLPEFREEVESLDYALPERRGRLLKDVAEESQLLVYVNTDASEGIYIDAVLCSVQNGERFRIGTLKTLEEGPEACVKMGRLSGMLTWAFERYLGEFY